MLVLRPASSAQRARSAPAPQEAGKEQPAALGHQNVVAHHRQVGAAGFQDAEQAHDEYINALRERGPIRVPFRFGVRTYAEPDGNASPPP